MENGDSPEGQDPIVEVNETKQGTGSTGPFSNKGAEGERLVDELSEGVENPNTAENLGDVLKDINFVIFKLEQICNKGLPEFGSREHECLIEEIDSFHSRATDWHRAIIRFITWLVNSKVSDPELAQKLPTALVHEVSNAIPNQVFALLGILISKQDRFIETNALISEIRQNVEKLRMSVRTIEFLMNSLDKVDTQLCTHLFRIRELYQGINFIYGFQSLQIMVSGKIPDNLVFVTNKFVAGIALREVLTNSKKHGDATEIIIRVWFDEPSSKLCLEVEDNGLAIQTYKPRKSTKQQEGGANSGYGSMFINSTPGLSLEYVTSCAQRYSNPDRSGSIFLLKFDAREELTQTNSAEIQNPPEM